MITQLISQKEAFLKYLQLMDVEMLDLILEDSITYFGASKKVFLEKLKYIFGQVSIEDSNSFKIIQNKRFKNKYSMHILAWSYTLQLIIEEEANKITRIYNNKVVKNQNDVDCLSEVELFFGDDEKADFIPTTEYILNLHHSEKAYEELINDKIQVLSSEDIARWVNKHAELYAKINSQFRYFGFNKFKDLYFGFLFDLQRLRYYPEVRKALESFNCDDHKELGYWLKENFNLAFCKVLGFEGIPFIIDDSNKRIGHCSYPNIFFKGDDFFALMKFNQIYHKHYDLYPKI